MKFFIIIFSLSINLINSIRIEDFCFQSEECQSKYCKQECEGQLSHQCGYGLCSNIRHSCQSIKLWSILTINAKTDVVTTSYQNFILGINNCPQKIKYQLKSNDFCISGTKCYYKQKLPFRLVNRRVEVFKYSECKCLGKHKFKCERNICAKDRDACNVLWLYDQINEPFKIRINSTGLKKCLNFNTEIY